MPIDDLTGKTAAELRDLAETYRAQAHGRIVDALDPIIGLALVVMALDKLAAAQAGAGQAVFVDLSALKSEFSSTQPVPVFIAPDATKPALSKGQPRFDTDFDLFGVRVDGVAIWLLVYRKTDPTGAVTLEYWIRLADVRS